MPFWRRDSAIEIVEKICANAMGASSIGAQAKLIGALFESDSVGKEAMDLAVTRLVTTAMRCRSADAAAPLHACGILFQRGAEADEAAEEHILQIGRAAVSTAARYLGDLHAMWDERAGDGASEEVLQRIAARFDADRDPNEVAVANHLPSYALALRNLLLSSKSARAHARKLEGFRRDAFEFVEQVDEPQGALHRLLSAPVDEQFLVLVPDRPCGYWVEVDGVTHNFQLHSLLADAIVGDPAKGFVDAKRPHEAVVAAARDSEWTETTPVAEASFHLQTLAAIQSDGTIDADGMSHVLWHEGTPSDIPGFAGTPVIVVSPLTMRRTWRAPRDFGELAGRVEVVDRLGADAVTKWIRRIAEHRAGE